MDCNNARKSKNNRLPLAFILIAVVLIGFTNIGLLWPVIFILLPGLMLLFFALNGGKLGALMFAVPGMLVAGTGALLTLQNLTGYWESWAYAWTLYAVFLGLAFSLMGSELEEPFFKLLGRWFVYGGMFAFTLFGVFFELLIFGSLGTIGAVLFIAAGLYLMAQDKNRDWLAEFLGGSSQSSKLKRKMGKAKRKEDALFTGPIVYGSTVRTSNGAPISVTNLQPDDTGDAEL